jgi:hypothetical protein
MGPLLNLLIRFLRGAEHQDISGSLGRLAIIIEFNTGILHLQLSGSLKSQNRLILLGDSLRVVLLSNRGGLDLRSP